MWSRWGASTPEPGTAAHQPPVPHSPVGVDAVSTMEERAIGIIAEQLRVPVDRVLPEAHLIDDLKADSLDVVDLTIAIEELFSTDAHPLEISEDDAAALQTVQNILDYLRQRGVE